MKNGTHLILPIYGYHIDGMFGIMLIVCWLFAVWWSTPISESIPSYSELAHGTENASHVTCKRTSAALWSGLVSGRKRLPWPSHRNSWDISWCLIRGCHSVLCCAMAAFNRHLWGHPRIHRWETEVLVPAYQQSNQWGQRGELKTGTQNKRWDNDTLPSWC